MKKHLAIILTAALLSSATAQSPSTVPPYSPQVTQWWQAYAMTAYWYLLTTREGGHIGPRY